MTNEQKIKSMSTEELAEYIFELGNGREYCYGHCIYQDEKDCTRHNCLEGVTAWLKQEISSDSIRSSGWISVKDKLPETAQFCFVACHEWDMFEDALSSTVHFRVLQYLPDVGCWNVKTPVQVLAWMPIPELPEK